VDAGSCFWTLFLVLIFIGGSLSPVWGPFSWQSRFSARPRSRRYNANFNRLRDKPRSFCPSCEKKRALVWAEWVRGELLEAVAHRHVVFTIPRLLRPLFRRRRELLTELGHAAAAAIGAFMQEALGARVRRPVLLSVWRRPGTWPSGIHTVRY
jgi:hypothetical protein